MLNCFHGEPLSTEKQRLNGSGSATPRLNGLNLNSQSTNLVINGIFTCSCRIFFNKTRGRGKLILNLFFGNWRLIVFFSHCSLFLGLMSHGNCTFPLFHPNMYRCKLEISTDNAIQTPNPTPTRHSIMLCANGGSRVQFPINYGFATKCSTHYIQEQHLKTKYLKSSIS